MNTARTALSAACLSSAIAAAGAASAADPDPAQASFDEGVAHMEAGRFEQGCPAIAQSLELDPRPGTLFTLAECEALRGRIATAIVRFDEYLALYPALTPEQQRHQGDRADSARAQRQTLAREVPQLTLALPPDAPPRAVVELDGEALAPTALGRPLPVDPGEHLVRAHAPGRIGVEHRVRLDRREAKRLRLDLAPEAPRAAKGMGAGTANVPPAAAPDPGGGGRRAAAYLAGGLGLVGIAVGGVTGALAMERKGVVARNCVRTACNHEGMTAADGMKTLGLASTIGFGVGIAGAGAAAVLLLTEPRAASAGASGRTWVAAGVAPVGLGGAALDVRGAW